MIYLCIFPIVAVKNKDINASLMIQLVWCMSYETSNPLFPIREHILYAWNALQS